MSLEKILVISDRLLTLENTRDLIKDLSVLFN